MLTEIQAIFLDLVPPLPSSPPPVKVLLKPAPASKYILPSNQRILKTSQSGGINFETGAGFIISLLYLMLQYSASVVMFG